MDRGAGGSALARTKVPPSARRSRIARGVALPQCAPAATLALAAPAPAVVVGRHIYLFDAGPGVERRLAAAAQPCLLVLHHIVRIGGTDEELLAGIRAGGFAGPVAIGRDLDSY